MLRHPWNSARTRLGPGEHDASGLPSRLSFDRCPHHGDDDQRGCRRQWILGRSGWHRPGGRVAEWRFGGPARSGSRTVKLTGLPPNCTIDGPASRRVTIVDNEAVPIEFAVVCTGSRTIRLDILNNVYPDLTLRSPSRLPWTVRCMTSRSPWAAVPSISVALDAACTVSQAQFYYYASGWIGCQRHPGWNGPPVSTIEADTAEVELELVSTVHCHFR